jgi:hypothetical protein
MNRFFRFLFFILFIHAIGSVKGQEIEPILPDRPGLGESAQIVPLNNIQFETGGNLEFDGADQNRSLNVIWNNLTIRWGVFKDFELRLATNIEQGINGTGVNMVKSKIGFAPFYVGFKSRVCQQIGIIPRTVLLGNLGIPYLSSDVLKTKTVAPSMLIPMEWDLSKKLLMTINSGIFLDGESEIPSYFGSFGFDLVLPKNFGVFAEYYFNADEVGAFQPGFNGGVVWRVMPNLQLDFSAGVGLNNQIADGFLNGGLSYKLPYKK